MFDDHWWVSDRIRKQQSNLYRWLDENCGKKITAIELGAGTAIPSVRNVLSYNTKNLIRINPTDCDVSKGQVPIEMSALSALTEINKLL